MPHSANDNEKTPETARGSCPVCEKPRDVKYRPFCSKHCADVDLARWLGGRYAIPASPGEDEDEGGDLPPGARETPGN